MCSCSLTPAATLLTCGKVWHTRQGDKARSQQATARRREYMEAKKGDGLLMVYCDVPAEHEEEFNRWYNEEHIPERLSIPGVLNAARYQAVDGGPKYLACYELASPDAWYAEAWQQWLRNPAPWSQRMS